TRKLTLVVDEGDNRPLNLSSVRLDLPAYHLRFFYPTRGKLSLLYGNDTLAAPRYDLELLAPRLVGVFSREITLNPQGVSISAGNFEARVFWLALAAAALVILVLLGRLLRSEPVQS
ncbi:MAG TPA: hypothetical protein VFY29_02820, partial [Terriglobia bacterium]|nr:hypothetical protein [Terriglobia bacterium]